MQVGVDGAGHAAVMEGKEGVRGRKRGRAKGGDGPLDGDNDNETYDNQDQDEDEEDENEEDDNDEGDGAAGSKSRRRPAGRGRARRPLPYVFTDEAASKRKSKASGGSAPQGSSKGQDLVQGTQKRPDKLVRTDASLQRLDSFMVSKRRDEGSGRRRGGAGAGIDAGDVLDSSLSGSLVGAGNRGNSSLGSGSAPAYADADADLGMDPGEQATGGRRVEASVFDVGRA